MKFCLVNNLFPPYQRGGAEKIVSLIANGLKDRGEVSILTSQPSGGFNCQLSDKIKICRFYPENNYYLLADHQQTWFKKLIWHFNDLFSRKNLKTIEAFLNQEKPQIISTHNLAGLGWQLLKAVKKSGAVHIHTLHDYQLLDPHGSMRRHGQNLALKGLFYTYYRHLTKKFISSPDLVISPSQFILDKHLAYGFFKNVKTKVLPNPAALPENFSAKRPSAKLCLLYLGQLEEAKGLKFLLSAFQNLPVDKLILNIAGTGSLLDELQQKTLSLTNVNWLGRFEPGELPQLFAMADLLVVPSVWWENSPTVIYEAYGFKTPVLVSDSGGSKELVQEGKTGWVFKSADQQDFIEKINLALKLKNDLPKMGESGFNFISRFSLNNYIQNLVKDSDKLIK